MNEFQQHRSKGILACYGINIDEDNIIKSEDLDLIKGRGTVTPIGQLSKNGKDIKTANGWVPVKKHGSHGASGEDVLHINEKNPNEPTDKNKEIASKNVQRELDNLEKESKNTEDIHPDIQKIKEKIERTVAEYSGSKSKDEIKEYLASHAIDNYLTSKYHKDYVEGDDYKKIEAEQKPKLMAQILGGFKPTETKVEVEQPELPSRHPDFNKYYDEYLDGDTNITAKDKNDAINYAHSKIERLESKKEITEIKPVDKEKPVIESTNDIYSDLTPEQRAKVVEVKPSSQEEIDKAGTVLTFANQKLLNLWENEMSGQISDGQWENSRNTEWLWRDTAVKLGDKTKVEVKRGYGYNNKTSFPFGSDLKDIVGERATEEAGFKDLKETSKAWKEINDAIKNHS
jgi:hypothetical protein